ncbi:hypothetical protein JCM8097_009249 [Rhodosporidiobolus ruineniae]
MIVLTPPEDEKPLLPFAISPSSSRAASPPPHLFKRPETTSTASSSSYWARFFASRRRWLAVVCLYLLVAVAFRANLQHRLYSTARSFPRFSWRCSAGDRLVHDAYGQAYPVQPLPSTPDVVEPPSLSPSTSLGPAADAVYHLFPPPSSPSPAILLATLETFLRTHFPPADSDLSDPSSLINAVRSFSPSPSDPPVTAEIPKTIWQTAPDQRYFELKEGTTNTWLNAHPGWNHTLHDNAAADEWVRTRFSLSAEGGGEGEKKKERGVVAAWDRFATPAVLRSDFWRYLVLAVEGGVYADTDVECLKPVERWGEDPSWEGKRPDTYTPPSLIVGIEADVGSRHDWHDFWPRPLQISQWTMAAARGHPIMLDAVRRIVEIAVLPEEEQPRSVMEKTGPGVFTDSVLSYLLAQYRKPWGTLRGLGLDGWRFRASIDAPEVLQRRRTRNGKEEEERWGDVKVLSITGFSPGVGHMGAQGRSSPGAMAAHQFAGSWRLQKGADA